MPSVQAAQPAGPDRSRWLTDDLPAAVRSQILLWASDVLTDLPADRLPASLTRVARFTPVKRARLGAQALATAVDSDQGFRAMVAERAATRAALDGSGGTATIAAAGRAVLLGLPDREQLIEAVVRDEAAAGERDALQGLRREIDRLTDRLAAVTAERDAARATADDAAATNAGDLDRLRLRLRDQGARLRAADRLQAEVAGAHQVELDGLRTTLSAATASATAWQQRAVAADQRAGQAQEALARLREAGPKARATADRRLELLLSTVEGAAAGLRREWDLIGGGQDPADLVAAGLPVDRTPAERTHDPARLSAWLSLPGAHLIVDGYNVTKSGYPGLTLAQQRERLLRQLSVVSARTSAEVTVVFDGADVMVPRPASRGIRLLFSPVGVIADDVIRDLVAAEPAGRVVIVVSSDKEVADGVSALGARTAASSVLLAVVGPASS